MLISAARYLGTRINQGEKIIIDETVKNLPVLEIYIKLKKEFTATPAAILSMAK
jgi:hypothetical protein